MEVHSHSHTESLPAGKAGKKFKHYLWEFLMLFLAVFCGFLAENLREHFVENQRARQYIRSFVEDLQTDTTNFTILIGQYKEKTTVLDKLFDCYDTVTGNYKSNACLFGMINSSDGFPDLVYSDRTIQQLKNAGGLRLLNKADADSITAYDNELRSFQKAETTTMQETQTLLRNMDYEVFNFKFSRQLWKDSLSRNVNLDVYPPLVPSNNVPLLNKYFNVLLAYTRQIHDQIYGILKLKEKASSLIEYFHTNHGSK